MYHEEQSKATNDDNLSSEVGGCQFVKANLITMSSKASYGLCYDGVTDQHFGVKSEPNWSKWVILGHLFS